MVIISINLTDDMKLYVTQLATASITMMDNTEMKYYNVHSSMMCIQVRKNLTQAKKPIVHIVLFDIRKKHMIPRKLNELKKYWTLVKASRCVNCAKTVTRRCVS